MGVLIIWEEEETAQNGCRDNFYEVNFLLGITELKGKEISSSGWIDVCTSVFTFLPVSNG